MSFLRTASSLLLACALCASAEDEKVKDKVYLSKANQIARLGTPSVGGTRFIVLSLKNRLDGKNSKGRAPEESSNFGDSASTYCYAREADLSDMERELLVAWFQNGGSFNLLYTCGEALEEEKRKSFPGIAETNCQCLGFSFKAPASSRGMWR